MNKKGQTGLYVIICVIGLIAFMGFLLPYSISIGDKALECKEGDVVQVDNGVWVCKLASIVSNQTVEIIVNESINALTNGTFAFINGSNVNVTFNISPENYEGGSMQLTNEINATQANISGLVEAGEIFMDDNKKICMGKGGLGGALQCDSILYSDGTYTRLQIESPDGIFGENPDVIFTYFNVNSPAFPAYVPMITGDSHGFFDEIFLMKNGIYLIGGASDAQQFFVHSSFTTVPRLWRWEFDQDLGLLTLISTKAGLASMDLVYDHEGDIRFDNDNMKVCDGEGQDVCRTFDATRWLFTAEVGSPNMTIDMNGGFFNVVGNWTGNDIRGSMQFHNDTDPNVTIIPSANESFNVTAFGQGYNIQKLNGVSYTQNKLIIDFNGAYEIQYWCSASGSSNNKYHFVVGINGDELIDSESHLRVGSVNDIVPSSGAGEEDLTKGDEVTLMVLNEDGGNNIIIHSCRLKVSMVGT